MNYSVIATPRFKRDIKSLCRKYISLAKEYAQLLDELEENPQLGIPIGNNCFKIRISIASKGRGKSGGARIITNVAIRDNIVFLLTIYDKSEKETVSAKELQELLNQLPD